MSKPEGKYDVYIFLALACCITWAVDLPMALAFYNKATAPAYALPLAGLGAFGPTIAAFILGLYRGTLKDIFGRWRAPLLWVGVGLLVIPVLHLPATLIEVALGGTPAHWFYPPTEPERIAALIMFPLGEEMGWRGYGHSRITRLHGPVIGSLVLGAVWGIWHLFMMFTPEKGPPAFSEVLYAVAQLALGSLIFAWVFERGQRGLTVAIALHMGAHIDNVDRAPETEIRLRLLRLAVLAVAAFFAGRALLHSTKQAPEAPHS